MPVNSANYTIAHWKTRSYVLIILDREGDTEKQQRSYIIWSSEWRDSSAHIMTSEILLSMGVWGTCKRSRRLKILARLQRRLTASDFKNVLEKREREREKMRKGWWRREARKPLTVQRHRCRGLQRKLCPDMKIHNPNSNERERETGWKWKRVAVFLSALSFLTRMRSLAGGETVVSDNCLNKTKYSERRRLCNINSRPFSFTLKTFIKNI